MLADGCEIHASIKPGLAPAADSGSSGPHGTGEAEPGSGKAAASGWAASCPVALLLPPWASAEHGLSRSVVPQPRVPLCPSPPGWGSGCRNRSAWEHHPPLLWQGAEWDERRWPEETSGSGRSLPGKVTLHPLSEPQRCAPPQFTSLTHLSCRAQPPSFSVSLLRLHHTHQRAGEAGEGWNFAGKSVPGCRIPRRVF